jgi:hypothetical protein
MKTRDEKIAENIKERRRKERGKITGKMGFQKVKQMHHGENKGKKSAKRGKIIFGGGGG